MKLSTIQGQSCGPVWGLPGPWPPTGFPWQCCGQSETGISQRRVEVFLENFTFASHFPYTLSSQLSVSKDRVSCYRPLKFSFRWKKGFCRIARFWNNLSFLLERGNFKSRSSRDLIQLCMLTPPGMTILFYLPFLRSTWLMASLEGQLQVTSSFLCVIHLAHGLAVHHKVLL